MIEAISSILIYNPHGYAYENGIGGELFPITDQCERSAKVMGEDFVRLVFKLEHRVTFDAFSYIVYNGQTFFLREQYIPTPNGSIQDGSDVSSPYYSYDVKFVSVGNMLDKHICYRHVKVNGDKPYEWYEPEIAINGTLETMYVIVMGAIKRIGDEYAAQQMHYGTLLQSIAANGLDALGIAPNKNKVKITEGTKLLTFNFSGNNIANVCTTIANNYTNDDNKDTEWYITEDESGLTLHFAKYVSDAGEQVVSDYIKEDVDNYHYAHPYVTGGLKKVEYAQAWSGITQKIVPYGSDRNMSGQAVKGIDEITQLQSTFGKRLRLDPNTSYNVKGKDGNMVVITTDHNGAVENNYVNTGIEQVKFYDDIYPQGHFKITSVTIKNKRQEGETIPEYTIEASPIDSNGNDISKESVPDGFYPIKIEEGTTLSVRFEKGMLNGREFEIANKTRKDEGATTYSLKFTIVADGSIEDGTLIPSGNFRPYEGDQFALFNMKMPEVYVTQAKNELAQKVYDELVELQTTRPEVKCTTDPVNFAGEMALGNVYRVSSELFNSEHTFVSRVISYSYKLTKTNDIQFSLASAIMQGTLSSINDLISDVTHATGGLEQRAINLSRRAWRDASEVAEMIDSITTEMMLVGSEKNQFAFTMGIECVDINNKFGYLEVGYGSIQHTQEPYIDYANQGFWEVGTIRLSKDEAGQDLNPDLAYYLYAKVDETTSAQMVLSTEDNSSNETYLLLGILSSEFEDKRVFSRTNGFTAMEGGTITTEQIQDAGRNLIIDFQSNPPRIIARGDAKITGNIEFELTKEQAMDIANKLGQIGGENLLPFTALHHDYKLGDTLHLTKLINLDAGKKYISTYGKFENNAGGAINEAFNDVCLAIGTEGELENIERVVKFGEPFEVEYNGRELYLAWALYDYVDSAKGATPNVETTTAFTQYLDEVMVQEGEVATAFQPYVEHITNALEGSTEVAGGLVMTNLLMLKDENGKVTAGMSGLQGSVNNPEKILMWGGGTYYQAAAASHMNEPNITTILKKDGTGKIGVFHVKEDNATVKTSDGKVVIDDTDGIGCYRPKDQDRAVVLVTPKELLPFEEMKKFGNKETASQSFNYDGGNTRVDVYGRPDGNYYGSEKTVEIGFIANGGALKINGGAHAFYVNQKDEEEITLSGEYLICILKDSDGKEVSRHLLTYSDKTIYIDKSDSYSVTFMPAVYVSGTVKHQWEQDVLYQYHVGFDSIDTYFYYEKEYYTADRQTMVAYKGIFSYQNEFAYLYYKDGVGFDCYVENVRFSITKDGIKIDGLKDESQTQSGFLFKDSNGFVKVKS